MAEIHCTSEQEIDIIDVQGVLEDDDLIHISQIISTLRQQNSTKLLILGKSLDRVAVKQWRLLDTPMRNFRQLGGVIALAEFKDSHLKMMRYPSWFQYVNTFKSKPEAKLFLDPNAIDGLNMA